MCKWKEKTQKGIITLEACISVLFFLMLMLLLAGLFRMFMAQNLIAHATLETVQSLSLDAYSAKKIGSGNWGSVGELINNLFDLTNNDDFSSYKDWYSAPPDLPVKEVVKTRFIAYISGGDKTKADDLLRRLNIEDGIEGIDFSDSVVKEGVLYVVLKYRLEYDFKIGGLGEIEVTQKACAKIWQ